MPQPNDIPDYWATFPTPGEAQQQPRASYTPAALSRGIVDVAIRIIASQFAATPTTPVATLANGIKRLQVTTANGVRITILGWPLTAPLTPYVKTLVGDDARESLCICVLATRDLNVDLISQNAFLFYPADIDAIARQHITGWELLDYKSSRRYLHGRRPIETEYLGEPKATSATTPRSYFTNVEPVPHAQQNEWIHHPLRDELDTAIRKGRWSLLVGNSSSGKSVLALQAAHYLRLAGTNVAWANVGTHGEPPPNLLSSLAHDVTSRAAVFVIDDLQSSPGAGRYLASVLRLLQRAAANNPPTVIGISWPSFARDILQGDEEWLPISVNPSVIREALLHKYASLRTLPDVTDTIDLLGDDLLLVRLFLERTQAAGRAVNADELATHLVEQRTTPAHRANNTATKTIIVIGSLGQFDIAPSERFVTIIGAADNSDLASLANAGLVRRQGDTVTLGHRSLSGLLADWAAARDAWNLLPEGTPRNTNDLVLAYLRSLESTRALDTLSALSARAQFRDRQKLNPRAALIVEIWHAFLAVLERIEQQQRLDPTWGRDPSSAMFAAQALARVGKTEAALRSINFLRQHWRITSDAIEIDLGAFSTKRDFAKIIEAMEVEDKVIGEGVSPAATINADRFHKTWLTGVILCAEAVAEPRHAQTSQLIAAIEAEAEPSGNFYPARVPWSSARVLLGLAGVGRTIHNSAAVRECVKWLQQDQKNNGARRAGIWSGGTGTWNRDLETTALVLLALDAAGTDTSTEAISRQFLRSQQSQWTAQGEELDGAVALHAYLETGGDFSEVAESARHLSVWARGEALWRDATARSDFEQSCRVAQIAAHLVNIGWTAVRANLPLFLEALEPRKPFRLTPQAAVPTAATTTTSTSSMSPQAMPQVSDPLIAPLEKISEITLAANTVVGAYRRYDERVRHELRDYVERMQNALVTKTATRENFLIWAAPGSGKSFLVQELGRSLGDAINYHEVNLAKLGHDAFVAALAELKPDKPLLCLLDEIDARENEKWPYDEAFPYLDWNTQADRQAVYVIIGSCPNGLHALQRLILDRHKGQDLLDRVPLEHRFEIPPTTIEDRVTIIASKVIEAAQDRGQTIDHIEKLAVYYALAIPELQTPRQLRELITAAVLRTATTETRLRYDHLFQRGDPRNQRFWADHIHAVDSLAGRFIRIIP